MASKGLLTALPSLGVVIVAAAGLAGLAYADYKALFQTQLEKNLSIVAITNDKENGVEPRTDVTNLFGTLEPQATPTTSDLPETRLQLTLKGTFTHSEKHLQSALISANKNLTTRYILGDEVIPGAPIISIEPGIVTLRRNGQDEILKLPLLSQQHEKSENKTQAATRTAINSGQSYTTNLVYKDYTKINSQLSNQEKIKLKKRLDKLRSNQQKN